MLFEVVVIKYLLGRGETLISRQHGLAGLEEFNHNEGGKHNSRKYGSKSHVVGGRGEARQAQAAVGLAILNQGHLERVIGECWRAKGASAGSTLATFVAPLGEITDGRKLVRENNVNKEYGKTNEPALTSRRYKNSLRAMSSL